MNALSGWQNFYVIVGSSAGTLIGLQFIVLTLIAGRPIARGQENAGSAFATPTIVYFGTVLLLSAALNAPWRGAGVISALLGMVGLGGVAYLIIVTRRLRRTSYRPQFEDWLCHSFLPFAAYATLAASAFEIRSHAHEAMFGVAVTALLLLFIGIHNAWDGVIYHVFVQRSGGE